MKTLSLIFVSLCLSAVAHAIPVKDCPAILAFSVGAPKVSKSYAKPGFDEYFANDKIVNSILKLARTANSECYYEGSLQNIEGFYQATLKGSLRKEAYEPAVIVAYAQLPISSRRPEKMPLRDLTVYFPVTALKKNAITIGNPVKFFRVAENCSYGECSQDYVYVGEFEKAAVEAR